MKDQFAKLLNTEMDRKDFLKYVAAAGVMAVGAGALLHSVGGLDKLGAGNQKNVATKAGSAYGHGYGMSPYGGRVSS